MKLTKIISLMLAAVLMLVSFAACGSTDNGKTDGTGTAGGTTKADDKATVDMSNVKLVNDGKILVAAEIGYPPFENYAADGTTPIGLDVDIADEISKLMGVDFEFVNTAFDGILDGLAIDKYDMVISAVTITAERNEQVDFSTPYIQNYQAIVVKKGSDFGIKDLLDLKDHSVGFQTGTISADKLDSMESTGELVVDKKAYDQILDAFSDLKLGRLDAILCDQSVADGYVAQDPDSYEIVWVATTDPEEFAIAVKKGNTELLKAVNEAMAIITENGTLDDLKKTWLGSDAADDAASTDTATATATAAATETATAAATETVPAGLETSEK